MHRGWFLLLGLLAMTATAQAATVTVDVGRDDATDPAATFLRYFPETVVVWEGDTVTWEASSNAPHTVTGEGFDSTPALRRDDPILGQWFGPGGFLLPGQSFNHTFDRPGTIQYFCKIHPAMTGTIRVVNATTSGGSSGGTGLPLPGAGDQNRTAASDYVYVTAGWGSGQETHDSFGPADVTVATGTTVVWTNLATSEPHTVTASPPSLFDSSPKVAGEPSWWNARDGMMSLHGQNKEFSHAFPDAGHFLYQCKIHPGMVGTVIVLEKPSTATGGNTTGNPSTTTDAGSRVPGLEAPLLVLGLLAVAALTRRRA